MNKRNLVVILVILGVLGIFFRPIFGGHVPIPFDGLLGVYYPWLDYKWGYLVGVPVKNISITDVFSQLYPWRLLSMEAIRAGQWPLWNPYSFSGTPLLANWQSAPFYPLNILMLILGDVWGWTAIIICQPLLSIVFMFIYLRVLNIKRFGALVGGVVFAFSGFMVTYLEYATAGQIFLWLPLQLFFLEKYFKSGQLKFLIFASGGFFMVATGGFFQPALYVGLMVGTYYLVRAIGLRFDIKRVFFNSLVLLLGLGLAAIQLIPTAELLSLSIRSQDHNIFEYKYGLLPLKNLVTFLAPDFFGNPATNNFWGFMGYQETSGYFGVISVIIVLGVLISRRKSFFEWFFSISFLLSLLLAVDNPISRLIYGLNVPGLATGYASRWLLVTTFSAAILVAYGFDRIQTKKLSRLPGLLIFGLLLGISLFVFISIRSSQTDVEYIRNFQITWRNLYLPVALVTLFLVISRFFDKRKFLWLIAVLIVFDSLRYSIKFTPFVPIRLAEMQTPVTNYLKENVGYGRIENESGQPLMPANSWTYFRLMSPSGYDPLIVKNYEAWYRIYNNEINDDNYKAGDLVNGWFTRYLNLNNYRSSVVDLAGVRYLLAIKMNKISSPDKNGVKINDNIPLEKYKKVFEDGAVIVFENQKVMNRVLLFDQWEVETNPVKAMEIVYDDYDFKNKVVLSLPPEVAEGRINPADSAEIVRYSANEVLVRTKIKGDGGVLVLTDTYYPGWKVKVNNNEKDIMVADGIYRAVEVPKGESEVKFFFWPESFKLGLVISSVSFIALMLLLIGDRALHKKSKKDD
jgi:hypothetical protein